MTDYSIKNNNIIICLLIGILISLFIFYMTDSKIYKNLSKETFFNDNTEHTNITEPETYTELVDNYTKKINDNIDTYLNGISTNMIEVKGRNEVLKGIGKNLDTMIRKMKNKFN